MNELSKFIKTIGNSCYASSDHMQSFLPAYKAYHKRQNIRRNIFKMGAAGIAGLIVACLSMSYINTNELDIDTAAGEYVNKIPEKKIVFEGNVSEVTVFIKTNIKEKTDTLCLKEYFNGEDVWGVYVRGDEKFRFYYQCMGKGKYIVFTTEE